MRDVIKRIKEVEGRFLILTHHNADIDATASAVALELGLKKIGKDVKAAVAESVSRAARGLCGKHELLVDPDCSEFDVVVLVDTSVPEQLLSVKNLRADIIIDHHPAGKLAQGAVCWIDESQKSSAQMVYKILKCIGIEIDREIAKIIASGIVGDTAHLRLAEREEFLILAELLKTGIKYSEVLSLLECEPDISERIACLKACVRAQVYRSGDVIIAISDVASHEAASCRTLLRAGADISVVVAKKKDQIRISSRAKQKLKGKINLSKIFKRMGDSYGGSGGGHDMAGSANILKGNEKEVKDAILKELRSVFGSLTRLE